MPRILYIEDDRNIQRVLARVFALQWPEYTLDVVADAPAAILMLKTVAYAAILSDYNLEVGTGGDVLAWIELNQPRLFKRFLFLTSDTSSVERFDVPVLEKPCGLREVERVLSELLAVDAAKAQV